MDDVLDLSAKGSSSTVSTPLQEPSPSSFTPALSGSSTTLSTPISAVPSSSSINPAFTGTPTVQSTPIHIAPSSSSINPAHTGSSTVQSTPIHVAPSLSSKSSSSSEAVPSTSIKDEPVMSNKHFPFPGTNSPRAFAPGTAIPDPMALALYGSMAGASHMYPALPTLPPLGLPGGFPEMSMALMGSASTSMASFPPVSMPQFDDKRRRRSSTSSVSSLSPKIHHQTDFNPYQSKHQQHPIPSSSGTTSPSLNVSASLSHSPGVLKSEADSNGSFRLGEDNDESDPKRMKTIEELKDEMYWDRRKKNNEAAKRSRDARRVKEEQIAVRSALLEQENLKLRAQIAVLKSETSKLHYMLYNT